MSKLNNQLIMGELRGIRAIICALIGTHPDLTKLRRAFAHQAELQLATLLATEVEDASIGATRWSLERWSKDLDAAINQKARR